MTTRVSAPLLSGMVLAGALLMTPALGVAQDTAAPAAPAAAPAEPTAAPAPPAPPAAAPAAAGRAGAPAEGMGQIVFFRPAKYAGSAVGFKVREGETELCKLTSGVYCVVSVAPGTHTYVVHSEAKDELTVEVEAGETYYVQGTIGMGLLVGRPNLSPSNQATFDGMPKLKLAKPIEAAPPK